MRINHRINQDTGIRYRKKQPHHELPHRVAQRSLDAPFLELLKVQVEQGPEQPDQVGDNQPIAGG